MSVTTSPAFPETFCLKYQVTSSPVVSALAKVKGYVTKTVHSGSVYRVGVVVVSPILSVTSPSRISRALCMLVFVMTSLYVAALSGSAAESLFTKSVWPSASTVLSTSRPRTFKPPVSTFVGW